MKYALIFGLVMLAGCGHNTALVCPSIVPYSQSIQQGAAAELKALPNNSIVARMIEDYGELRAHIRAACK
ncbi:MAG: hypothetical protein ACK5PR_01820 [bacterium]